MHSRKLTLIGLICLSLGASACTRVKDVGRAPGLSPVEKTAEYQAMTTMAYAEAALPRNAGQTASLWTTSHSSLVSDRRASQPGDILTVVIQIDDRAEMQNSSGRSRAGADNVRIPQLMGLPQRLAKSLPEGATVDPLADVKSTSSYKGSGNISRRDKLTLRVAATVIDTLPNGVLRIEGTQEVRVNFELRELTVSGFVRPSDIGRRNEVAYDRIAGARISYGGRGQITDVQQPRYGQQIADIVLPY